MPKAGNKGPISHHPAEQIVAELGLNGIGADGASAWLPSDQEGKRG